MTIIAQRLEPVSIGKAQHFKNLTMFPLVDENPHEARYLLLEEALESGHARVTETKVAEKLLHKCATAVANRFPAIGEGHDIRLQGNGITGNALAVGERIIHLCAFRLAESEKENHHRGSRMARASVRRRYREDQARRSYARSNSW